MFSHASDDGRIDSEGRCEVCGAMVPVGETVMAPGPGMSSSPATDYVSVSIATPHRLLVPVRS